MSAIAKTIILRPDALVVGGDWKPRVNGVWPSGNLLTAINDNVTQPTAPNLAAGDAFLPDATAMNEANYTFPDVMVPGLWVSKLTLWTYAEAGACTIRHTLGNSSSTAIWCTTTLNATGAQWRSAVANFTQDAYPNLDANNLLYRMAQLSGNGQAATHVVYAEVDLSYANPIMGA